MDWWESLIATVPNISVVLIHTISLILLVTLKQRSLKGSQKLLLIALSLTELTYALLDIVQQICFYLSWKKSGHALVLFNSMTVIFMYIFIMTFIVIDRFLEIYLNIKYSLVCSTKKTNNILLVGLLVCFFLFFPFAMIQEYNIYDAVDILYRYIYLVFELIFIIFTAFSYFYIIRQVLKCRRSAKKLEEQLSKNSIRMYQKHSNNRFKLYVPTLIIVTFLLFMVVPNTLRLCESLDFLEHDVAYKISFFLIPVGFMIDPIIYIFSLKAVRLAVRRVVT